MIEIILGFGAKVIIEIFIYISVINVSRIYTCMDFYEDSPLAGA